MDTKKIKIVAFADTHGDALKLDKLSGCDVVICAGDFSTYGRAQDTAAFAYEFGKVNAKYRICIAGNHDWLCERHPDMARQIFRDNDIIYLQDEEIVIDGIKFYGTPWTPMFFDWAFMKFDYMLQEIYSKIPDDTHVLISHGPPSDILSKNAEGGECGSTALLKRLESMNTPPKLHIFGHIHHSSGMLTKGLTTYWNASLLDDNYCDAFEPQIFELEI